ncbi:glycoside hydrolase family 61 protein [Lasiosphaeria ovina]|uniref:lytic cellulose monooxygenase (C4-dehydrogenating) n=1 Tax=Lasiosphaeria ovina TaxID=92902 RepID=A0AAE0JYM8_9PEZI|nr:glycoside hydrolase family 61 protein [Lasiosphaeria ovina]
MKKITPLAALSLTVSQVSAHYIFQQLSIGSAKYAVEKYIRANSNFNQPVVELNSTDLRCNVGANGKVTDTVTVKAGDKFTFDLDTPVYHQGPVSLYMSKAPGAASDYDGSGGWFKIYDWGPSFSGGSATWNMAGSYSYNIPSCLANGDYLLRIQSLAIHNPWPAGIPQFYVSCAQITVTGGGSAAPGPTVLIPGAFKDTDPGYTVNIYTNFNNYTVPGPAVWSCGSSGSNPVTTPGATTAQPSTSTSTSTAKPATTSSSTTLSTSTRSAAPSTTTTPVTCVVAKYGQCGGSGYIGCTVCASGSSCSVSNAYYSQCL